MDMGLHTRGLPSKEQRGDLGLEGVHVGTEQKPHGD